MKAQSRCRFSGRFGLALLIAWPTLVIGLSAIGERVALIHTVTLLGILPVLLGAVAWLRAGHHHPKVFFQKRCITVACLVAALSVPLMHWPLALSFLAARPAMERLATKTRLRLAHLSYRECNGLSIQADLNTPVRCGLLKIETVGLEWVPVCSEPLSDCVGKDYEHAILRPYQLWMNRDGYGPTFFIEPEGKLSKFVANTPTPRLMLWR